MQSCAAQGRRRAHTHSELAYGGREPLDAVGTRDEPSPRFRQGEVG